MAQKQERDRLEDMAAHSQNIQDIMEIQKRREAQKVHQENINYAQSRSNRQHSHDFGTNGEAFALFYVTIQ